MTDYPPMHRQGAPVLGDMAATMTTGLVSRAIGVNRDTVLNWARDNIIPGVHKTPAGHFKIDVRVVTAIRSLAEQGVRLDARELTQPDRRAALESALIQQILPTPR